MLLILSGYGLHDEFKTATDKIPGFRVNERRDFPAFLPAVPTATAPLNAAESSLKVGFIYIGRIGDYGFTYAQNQGRLALIRELGVQTHVREMVPADERSMAVMQELIDFGCTVIFACSFGFMEYTAIMAEQNPDVYFFHCSGYITRENMSAYFGRMYQIRYLTGIVAGLRTETNQIGYVAAHRIPEVVRGANAFALGVKSVNPEAVIKINWSYSWYDPSLEKELALALIRSGCDVIAQHQDSLMPQIAAEQEGVWSIGYNSPMGFLSPNAYLTGALWNWGPYMVDQVRQIKSGTWQSSNYWGGIEDGVVMLEELTDNVAPGTREAVDEALRRIENGFGVFVGPIYDNTGKLRVSQGQTMTDSEKLTMDWFVDNVLEMPGGL
jgi:basic membrane protein A